MSFFAITDENVARNPVARAAAKARLRSTLRTFQIQLYCLPDGSHEPAMLVEALNILQVAGVAAELNHDATPGRTSVIKGAISAVFDRIEHRFTWRTRDAVAIDRGLTEALAALDACPATTVRQAWKTIREIQDQAKESA